MLLFEGKEKKSIVESEFEYFSSIFFDHFVSGNICHVFEPSQLLPWVYSHKVWGKEMQTSVPYKRHIIWSSNKNNVKIFLLISSRLQRSLDCTSLISKWMMEPFPKQKSASLQHHNIKTIKCWWCHCHNFVNKVKLKETLWKPFSIEPTKIKS